MVAAIVVTLAVSPAFGVETEISESVRLPAGVHVVLKPVRILSDGITLDLGDAELVGIAALRPAAAPDTYVGIGIIVEGRKNVTIRGGKIRGFRCGILIKDCERVTLENVDVSRNFRQRLKSTGERLDAADVLLPTDNERREWRTRYGAGICLENSRLCVVNSCAGRHQQNGLVLDRCAGCIVRNCDFSFNSGWGIALWRSRANMVSRNHCDWCVRGYSHGRYVSRQRSAGILMVEQSGGNIVVFNSATHCGNGLLLYAGDETVERTGTRGSNGNTIKGNDFSHAANSGVEITFSKDNQITNNVCSDCNYGIWAMYSTHTMIEGNRFQDNVKAGVVIGHGSHAEIRGNRFARNPVAVSLWWKKDRRLLGEKFGRENDVSSHDYSIHENVFFADAVAVRLQDTSGVRGADNWFVDVGERIRLEGDSRDLPLSPATSTEPLPWRPSKRMNGRRHILIDEWGPLDLDVPGVFPRKAVEWNEIRFRVLGWSDGYRVIAPEGIDVERGMTGFTVSSSAKGLRHFRARVRVGEEEFPFEGVLLRADWRVRFWRWDEKTLNERGAWAMMLRTEPLYETVMPGLDLRWQETAPHSTVPADGFATRAETKIRLPRGTYELRVIGDDGVRVFLDGKTVFEDWSKSGWREARVEVTSIGEVHDIAVEHYERAGSATLSLHIWPLAQEAATSSND